MRHWAWTGTATLLLGLAVPAAAQIPIPGRQETPAAVERPADPLGRDTPRGAISGFSQAVRRNDIDLAAQYLQTTPAQRARADTLARDLNDLFDRYFNHPITSLSAAPAGNRDDGLAADRERVELQIGVKTADLTLVRVDDGQGGRIWLVSTDSLAQVPGWKRSSEATWVDRAMPETLVSRSLFGLSLAQWTLWLASIVGPLLLLGLLSRLVFAGVRSSIHDPTRRALLEAWFTGLRWPIILLVTLAMQPLFVPSFGVPLGLRLRFGRYLEIFSVLVVSALVWRFMALLVAQATVVAQRRGRSSARSLMLLSERALKVVIVLVAVLAILRIAGVDTTTALAGVGIGGVAVALGAQKSVENLLGGVFLLSDNALAVGDFCCISDRAGWIEDITLRSVRLRTLDQTLLSIPAGALSQANIENFATRSKILIQTTLRLRYETTVEQLSTILDGIRRLLADQRLIERDSSRIRLVAFGPQAAELELFAYVLTADVATFFAVRENLLLQVAQTVEAAGSGFARPAEFLYRGDLARNN